MGIFKIIVMILDIWLAWIFFSDLMKEKERERASRVIVSIVFLLVLSNMLLIW